MPLTSGADHQSSSRCDAETPQLDRRQIETLQEIVIRAHYLSLELRDLCAPSGLAPAQMSISTAHMLRNWAIAFSRAIEAAEPRLGDAPDGERL